MEGKTKEFKYVNINSNYNEVGDEALQMKKNLPKEIVAVDHKRVNGLNKIMKEHPGVNCIILDVHFNIDPLKLDLIFYFVTTTTLFIKII